MVRTMFQVVVVRFVPRRACCKISRRWHSTTLENMKFDQALNAFYHEREALLRKSMSAVLKSKRKQVEGVKPRSIESTVASLEAFKGKTDKNNNDECDRPIPVLDLSGVFSNTSSLFKKGMSIKQIMRGLTRGSQVTSKFLPESQELSVTVYITPNDVDTLMNENNKWRLRAIEKGARQPLSVRVYPQKEHMVSCAIMRGQESDLVEAHRSLVIALETLSDINQGKEPAKVVKNVENPKNEEDVVPTLEKVSGAFALMDSSSKSVKIWGTKKQVRAATTYLDLLSNPFVKEFTMRWRKELSADEAHPAPSALPHLCWASFIIPTNRLNIIVGKDAQLLRLTSQHSGARIKFEPMPSSNGFVFTASGNVTQVYEAVKIVRDRLEEYEKFLQDIEWREHIAIRDREELMRLVGHDFVNVRKIELMTGAFLRISPPGDPVLSLRIWGSRRDVANAVKAVYALTRLDSPAII